MRRIYYPGCGGTSLVYKRSTLYVSHAVKENYTERRKIFNPT